MLRIAFFTAGTVGAGHLVRGLALSRALARNGIAADFKMFGPSNLFRAITPSSYVTVEICQKTLTDPRMAESSQLAQELIRYHPDLLIVDLFWAPLRYILHLLDSEAWLLIRKCPADWFGSCSPVSFDPALFRRIIGIEPLTMPFIKEFVDPVVICNPEECRPGHALKEYLGFALNSPLYIRLNTESHARQPWQIKGRVVSCYFSSPSPIFPIAEWLNGADGVIAAAGYNTFWESHWLGYSTKVVFIPQHRSIDDQAWRARSLANYGMAQNGADQLAWSMNNSI